MTRTRRARRGVALLEVLIAIAILSLATITLTALAGQVAEAIPSVALREDQARRAGRLLSRYALLPADELERRVGRRLDGEFGVAVTRLRDTTYELSVFRPGMPGWILRTAVYRPALSAGEE